MSGSVELGEFLEPGYFEQEERTKNENTALEDVWNIPVLPIMKSEPL